MRRLTIVALAFVPLSVLVSLLSVPVATYQRIDFAAADAAWLENLRQQAESHPNASIRERELAFLAGQWILEPGTERRAWVWDGFRIQEFGSVRERLIRWGLALWQPLFALLISGGLLTWTVRRERRGKAESG